MFKTLGGFCVAMCGTAAVLAWMDPSIRQLEAEPSPAELAEWAAAAVVDDVPLIARGWRQVDVVADDSPRGSMLAAASTPPPAHFHVDEWGRLSRVAYWDQQVSLTGDDPSIRILVSFPRETQRVSRRQWSSVQALIRAIESAGAVAQMPVPVRIGFDLNDRPDPAPARQRWVSQASIFPGR